MNYHVWSNEMDPKLLNNIRNILGITSIKKRLSEYLASKNIEPNTLVYPPLIQDIGSIQEISNRVELVPFMEELDPMSGYIKVGWNLFILGTNRKFLGYTVHESLDSLKRPEPTKQSKEHSLCYASGEEVLNFIIETLQKYNEDHISLGPITTGAPQVYGSKMPISNSYYEKNKAIGKSL